MAARRDPQEHLTELRAAIDADLTELGRRWRDARDEAEERRRTLAVAAGFVAGLMRRPRQERRRPIQSGPRVTAAIDPRTAERQAAELA